jgi:FKBP-type peptidyl-prolyl cis-trans isomerase
MSDDEMPQDMGMGGMGGDDDMSDEDMDYTPPSDLPEGIKKEIITEAPSANWKKPKSGDDVTVHYVGTLESDGTEFDSSRSRGKPFNFLLGKGQVIQGWDKGVATMKQGEVAKFTLSPEFAYGEEGSPPKIPANATLVFEVELLSWVSKDDLFQDGGVIKDEIKEGTGWKKPKEGDEIMMSLKATEKDGETVIDEKKAFEYVIGSGVLGQISKACDKALTNMKKGEEAKLTCTKDYAYGDDKPDGAVITLSLDQIYETRDCSFAKDKSLMKKQVGEGEGYDMPKDASTVKLKVDAATDGASALAGFVATTLEFTAGNGQVCDALESVVMDMKKGEKAVLTCVNPSHCVEEKLGLKEIKAEKVVLFLELVDFEKAKDTWNMSEEEKVDFGLARKDIGSDLFKRGRISLALERYKKVIDLFNYTDNFKEENKAKAKDLKKVCELNLAACHLKVKDYSAAKKSCSNVLKDERENVKALFRRAQADVAMKNFMDAMSDLKKCIDIDPQNKAARALYKEAQVGQKEEDKKSKGLFAKMCAGLGKGPIPPPGKDKSAMAEDDDMDDDEDDGMEEAKAGEEPKADEKGPAEGRDVEEKKAE